MNRNQCPNCGSHDTECVHSADLQDGIEETRICNSCPAEFKNSYSLFDQEVTGGVPCADCGDTIYGERAITTNTDGDHIHRAGWGCRE